MRVLVTDGEQRSALAVVRSLGRAGHSVHVCSTRRRSLAGASRYCRAQSAVTDPLESPTEFVARVEDLLKTWQIDVLLPITDAALLALLPERESFAHVRIPFPTHGQFRRICDKATVLEVAGRLGIDVPGQVSVTDPSERDDLTANSLRFPLVVKPARSVGEANGRRAKLGVSHVADWNGLQDLLDLAPTAAYPLLLQQRVVGPGIGVFLLVWGGELLAVFGHRRLREKPPSGGVSVYRESVAVQPELVARSRALLDEFAWEGVAMVEYKIDAGTGTPYLMEVNGRFWGSLQLAIDAGVDFPALLLAAACGERPQPVLSYREGVKCRWWWGDVDQLLLRLRRSREALALPPDEPGRWSALAEFLMSWKDGGRREVLRPDDPRPFLHETLQWLRGR